MKKNKLFIKFLGIACIIIVVMLINSVSKPQAASNQEQGQEQRDIVRRLAEDAPKKIAKSRRTSIKTNPNSSAKQPDYTFVSSTAGKNIQGEGIDIGFTFWLLKDSADGDSPEVTEKAKRRTNIKSGNTITQKEENVVVTPRRVNSNTKFSNGDWLRFSLDLPIDGYVYIFNKEQYIDGTLSSPHLMFPRQEDKGKTDKTIAGKLLFIPNPIDYFEIEETSESGKEKIAEVYYVLVSLRPIPEITLLKSNQSEPVNLTIFNKYEKYTAPLLKFESQNEANKAITKIERLSSVDGKETLSESDPLPQTVYRIFKQQDAPLFFSISAEIKK